MMFIGGTGFSLYSNRGKPLLHAYSGEFLRSDSMHVHMKIEMPGFMLTIFSAIARSTGAASIHFVPSIVSSSMSYIFRLSTAENVEPLFARESALS